MFSTTCESLAAVRTFVIPVFDQRHWNGGLSPDVITLAHWQGKPGRIRYGHVFFLPTYPEVHGLLR